MKKIIYSLAIVAAMSMASCNSSANKADEGKNDTICVDDKNAAEANAAIEAKINEATAQIAELKDEAAAKDYLKKAQEYVESLIKDGKAQEAKEYLAKIGPAITEKFPSLATVVEGANSLVNTAIEKAGNAADAAKEAAGNAVDAAKDKAAEAADAAKDKATEAAEAAKDKATEAAGKAVDAAKDKAGEAAGKAADAAKSLLPKK